MVLVWARYVPSHWLVAQLVTWHGKTGGRWDEYIAFLCPGWLRSVILGTKRLHTSSYATSLKWRWFFNIYFLVLRWTFISCKQKHSSSLLRKPKETCTTSVQQPSVMLASRVIQPPYHATAQGGSVGFCGPWVTWTWGMDHGWINVYLFFQYMCFFFWGASFRKLRWSSAIFLQNFPRDFREWLFRRPYPPAQPTLKSTTLSIVESWQFFWRDFSTSTPFFWQLFCWVLLCYAVCSQRILTTTEGNPMESSKQQRWHANFRI